MKEKQRGDGIYDLFDSGPGGPLPEPGAAGEILRSDGDQWISEAAIPVPGDAGEIIRSDGTDWESAAPGVYPWWEWNATDLSQFSPVVVGSEVAAHAESVVSYGGYNWISMEVTSTAPGGTSQQTSVVLPISVDPPGADYAIAFEFISITRYGAYGVVGAAAVLRFVDLTTSYFVRYAQTYNPAGTQRLGYQDFGKFGTQFIVMADPGLVGDDYGCRMAASVQGDASGVLARMIVGEPTLCLDTSPLTATGVPGLWQTTNSHGSATTKNYYRNIRCYLVSDVGSFEL